MEQLIKFLMSIQLLLQENRYCTNKSILPGKEYDAIRENPALRDHALFVGYGPVEDPKLDVAVIIENGESGSEVAAPIVKSAINFYTGRLNAE